MKPTKIKLRRTSNCLELSYPDGTTHTLSAEFLRVHSPSAEVRGHGPGQEVLQHGKKHVSIVELLPVGHYALQPIFSDKHDTGIFSWDYLYELGRDQETLWQAYLDKLHAAGKRRDPEEQVVQLMDPGAS